MSKDLTIGINGTYFFVVIVPNSNGDTISKCLTVNILIPDTDEVIGVIDILIPVMLVIGEVFKKLE